MKNVQKMLRDHEVEAKMVAYTDITGCSPEFYMEAAELLVECRRVLKYTYVYGYYLHDGAGKVLFEYQQASAEGITERLSEMFHAPIEEIAAQPLDFVNYIRVTKKYINNLVRSVEEEGFTSNDNSNDNNNDNSYSYNYNSNNNHNNNNHNNSNNNSYNNYNNNSNNYNNDSNNDNQQQQLQQQQQQQLQQQQQQHQQRQQH